MNKTLAQLWEMCIWLGVDLAQRRVGGHPSRLCDHQARERV